MQHESIINFQEYLLEKNAVKNLHGSAELQNELNNFIEEFNNWLTANFNDSQVEKYLVTDTEKLDLDNHFLERYNDGIRIYADSLKKPMRFLITESLELAMYQLAIKRGDFDRF